MRQVKDKETGVEVDEDAMEDMWEALSEDEKEDIGYVLGNKAFEDGYWKGVFHKLGKGKEYDAFYKAYNEINNVIPSDYLE